MRSIGADLRLERHWGTPWYVGTDLVCAVQEFSRHVGIEFWRGSALADPKGLLEGTGKNLRHVKLTTLSAASAPAFRTLLRSAIRLDLTSPTRTR
ncbi:MAG: DUF1801 domain-containing protein [Thermoplasmata archaeon]